MKKSGDPESAGQRECERAKPHYTLEELVAGITPENVHPETDWGPAVGRERFWEDE